MKGKFTSLFLFGVNHVWLHHMRFIDTVSTVSFFRKTTWRLLFSVGRWGFYIRMFWKH